MKRDITGDGAQSTNYFNYNLCISINWRLSFLRRHQLFNEVYQPESILR
jgi:hypothetical protein